MKIHKKYKFLVFAAFLFLTVAVCGIVGGRYLPVAWDAGACGGGYKTFVFDKYREELVQKHLDGSEEKENITSIQAVRGTQDARWEGRTIFLQFMGQRTWFDTFDWHEVFSLEPEEVSPADL